MLTRVDRVQLAVPDIPAAAEGWVELVGAVHDGDDILPALGARRSRYRLGTGWVEFLEPDGAGPVADAVSERGGHLFAGGVATPDLDAVVERLGSKGLTPVLDGGQAHLHPRIAGTSGVPLVVSRDEPQPPVGLVDFLYEITDLRHEAQAWMERYADLFGLDASSFVPISSDRYGYSGVLTIFVEGRLDRLEVITPSNPENTMGRFFAKFGEALYMCYAESGEVKAIWERARERGAPFTADQPRSPGAGPNGIFLHPKALGGVMLGVSRRTAAWQWSGHPERVEPVDA